MSRNALRATALALLVAAVATAVLLWSGLVAAAEDGQAATTAIPISTGAGGLGLGGGLAYWLLHGRVKSAEAALAALAPQLPALVAELRNAVDDFKAAIKAAREQEVLMRGKLHDLRDHMQRHEGMLIRVHERFNAMRDVIVDLKGSEAGVPRPLTDDVTGPVDVDTGRHRSLGRTR